MRISHLALVAAMTTLGPGVFAQSNVIVIISDDAGFADFGFQSAFTGTADEVPTPNLDTLASRGVLCTNAYTASVCSPSRAAIVTGSYQNRIGYEFNINNREHTNNGWDGLRPEVITIFEKMKAEGYTTGAVGKWHLGAIPDVIDNDGVTILEEGNRPPRQGVDEFFGILKGSRNYTVGGVNGVGTLREMSLNGNNLEVDTILETTAPWNTTYSYVTEAFGQGAVDFVDRHHDDDAPFFLYVAYTAPHGPIGDSPDIDDPRIAGLDGKRKQYASMVLNMDKEIGRLMDKLADPLGDGTDAGNDSDSIIDDTLVIFINDNGGASGNGTVNTPLQGWKGSPLEGGVRVPMIIAGPGITAVPGSNFDKPVHSIDILPTSIAAAGATPPTDIDGVNLFPFINGTDPGDPHQEIVIRSTNEISVRSGNWKLVKPNNSNPFALYDLSTDLPETTDVSGANPGIFNDLIRTVTDYEVGFDKPRHAGLGNGANSLNFNDHFIFNPIPPGGDFTPVATLIGGSTLNGDFNAGTASGADTYDETPVWQNIGTGDGSENATNTNNNNDGSRNAIIAETAARAFGIDTGYDLVTGDAFRASYLYRNASGWSNSDRVEVTLFVTDDNLITGTPTVIQALQSGTSNDGAYQPESHDFAAVSSTFSGKRLFVEINSAQTGSGFARLDDFVLERGTLTIGSGSTTANWSDANAWTDADTALSDTLLRQDGFAGCILEFPTTNLFSYVGTCNLMRPTDLPFMMNRLSLTGTFDGLSPQSGSIDGNELLFTNSLSETAPRIALDATGSDFSFELGNPLTLYHDLEIGGDGTSSFQINGTIQSFSTPRHVTKTGNSTLTLGGHLDQIDELRIEGGTIVFLDLPRVCDAAVVDLSPGTRLEGNLRTSGQLTSLGTVAPDSISTDSATLGGVLEIEIDGGLNDRLEVTGSLDISAATLDLSVLGGGLTRPVYPIASYGSLIGTFAEVTGLPVGYEIDYDFPMLEGGLGIVIKQPGALPLSGTVLIDYNDGQGGSQHTVDIRNGGFEDSPTGSTYDDLALWINPLGEQTFTATRTDDLLPTIGGSRTAVTSENGTRGFAIDTGWTLRENDFFDLSFYWRDASGWNDATDTFTLTLFTTDDDSIGGNLTELESFVSGTSQANGSYQQEIFGSGPVGASAEGKRLFLMINPTGVGATGNSFARFDNVSLRVATDTPADSYEEWIRDSEIAAAESGFEADPNGDGIVNGMAFIIGSPDAQTNALPLLPTAARSGDDLIFSFRRVANPAGFTSVAEYGSDLSGWTPAVNGQDGVSIAVTPNGYEPGVDRVDVTLPASLAADRKLFVRLLASE